MFGLFGDAFFIGFALFWLLSVVVWIWALVDCVRVPDDSMFQSGNKLIWVVIIVLLQVIGAVIYVAVGRPKAGQGARQTGGGSSALPPAPPPPI